MQHVRSDVRGCFYDELHTCPLTSIALSIEDLDRDEMGESACGSIPTNSIRDSPSAKVVANLDAKKISSTKQCYASSNNPSRRRRYFALRTLSPEHALGDRAAMQASLHYTIS